MARPTANPRPGADELDGRRAAILDAVVAEYIQTAQPVGSATVATAKGVGVSPATVRAEMVALEREGYLTQPHTSAGRVPTDRGYRFFVDHLATPGVLGPAQRTAVSSFFHELHGEMEQMLEQTSSMLAELTSHAAVVVGPTHEGARILSTQVVALSPRVVLVVAVLDDGAVEKATVEHDEDVDDEAVRVAARQVQADLEGRPLHLVAPSAPAGSLAARLVASIASIGERGEPEQVFIGGSSRLAASFDAVETVRGVLQILEQQLVVADLLHEVLSRGLSVAIGEEHGYEPLASCALVVAPITFDDAQRGVVGILGPTRMNYPGAIAAAAAVSSELARKLDPARHGDAEH